MKTHLWQYLYKSNIIPLTFMPSSASFCYRSTFFSSGGGLFSAKIHKFLFDLGFEKTVSLCVFGGFQTIPSSSIFCYSILVDVRFKI